MIFSVVLTRRDDYNRPLALAGVDVRPVRWSAGVDGGPKQAEIRITGPMEAMGPAFDLLRCGVRILNPDGAEVWAGFVWTIDLTWGGQAYTISLDDVANRVNVSYAALDGDGMLASYETGWIDDDFSQAIYGMVERRVNMEDEASSTAAAARAATELRLASLPRASRGQGDGEGYGATLTCVGVIRELDSRFYAHSGGRVEYEGGNTVSHPLGWQVSSNQFAFGRNKRGFSSFSDDLPPLPKQSQFSVLGSLSNDGTYTVSEPPSDETQSYTANTLWFDAADDIHDTAGGLDFIKIGQHLKVSGGLSNDGQYIIDGAGNDHVTVEGSGIVAEGTSSAPVSGTLTAAQRLETVEGIAADEMQNDATTFVLKVVGEKISQRFMIPEATGWPLWKVAIIAKTVGTPADRLRVSVYTDSSGTPGTLVDVGELEASAVGAESEWRWVEMQNAGVNTLAGLTIYHVVVERTGAFDSSNYWVIDITDDADNLYDYTALFYNGSSWVGRPTEASMPFKAWAGVDVTEKMETIVNGLRSLIAGVDVADSAGILVNPYEDGTRRGLDIVGSLREIGCADGAALVMDVIPDRRVLIRKAPTVDAYQRVRMDGGRPVFSLGGNPPPGQLFYGEWAADLSAPAQPAAVAPLTPIYIEEMEYTAESDSYQVRAEGVRSAFDLGYRNG